MAKHGGARKGAGRPTGSKSKSTLEVEAILEEVGIDPIRTMAEMLKNQHNCMQRKTKGFNPKLTYDLAKELAQYVAPKRKAVELTGAVGVVEDEGKMTKQDAANRLRTLIAAAREASQENV